MDKISYPNPDIMRTVKQFGSGLVSAGVAFFLLALVGINTVRFAKVEGDEVGVRLNKITGKLESVSQTGTHWYNGITERFYVLDKTIQTLDMTATTDRGERKGKDDLKIKTMDGSDVYVDVKVQYRIDPDMADTVVTTSGPGDNYKQKWTRDFVRSICRNYLGELTTEEFYDAARRDERLLKAREDVSKRLAPYGIIIDNIVIPTRPTFYKEYEEMIKRKKLADQAVLQEQSKALAAKQRQETQIVQETNKKNVAVEQFRGKMEQLVIEAKAEAEKAQKGADAYYAKITIGAEADFYRLQKDAEAILATKEAEAKGIEALKKALEGEGGRNMVKMEYAKRLKDLQISGQPYTVEGRTSRFEHSNAAAKARATK